jgi:ethanolamine utilization protein EutN
VQLGRVIGTLVATEKHEALRGVKLLIVQPLDPAEQPNGEPVVAVDGTEMAGVGELIFMIGGREAAQLLPPDKMFTPVDHGICGIVDQVYVVQRRAS